MFDARLNKISEIGVIVPIIWQLEVANVLLTSERRKRITKEQRQSALYALNELPITIDQSISKHVWNETIELAERYNLSLYDACYFELFRWQKATFFLLESSLMSPIERIWVAVELLSIGCKVLNGLISGL